MRHRRTTIFGSIAAIAGAIVTTVPLPHPWLLVAQLVGAAAVAMLGHSAADKEKPPNGK